jgi:thiol:disulfide interchange protein DsbD
MKNVVFLTLLAIASLTCSLHAQDNHATGQLYVRIEGSDIRAAIEVRVERGWHLYHGPSREDMGPEDAIGKPLVITLSGADVAWSAVRYPAPKRFVQDPGANDKPTHIFGHEGKVEFFARGKLKPGASGADVEAELHGLTCEEACVGYDESLKSSGAGSDALFARFPTDLQVDESTGAVDGSTGSPVNGTPPVAPSSTPGKEPLAASSTVDCASVTFPDYTPRSDPSSHGLGVWLALAFIAGMILNVMPCVLPVVSIKILSFVQQAGESRSRIFALGLSFAAGILVVFLVLAALAAFAGKGWGEQFQNPNFIVVMIAVVFAFSLSMFDVFELGVPSQVGALASGVKREGLVDAFFKGMMATVLATPCSGPFLGSTLAWSVTQSTATIFLIFLMIGLGMAAPYVVLTANPGALKIVPKPGAWMQTFKHLMGFLLLGTVVYLMTSLRQDLLLFTVAFLLFVALACWWWGKFATYDQSSGARIGTLLASLAIVGVGARLSFVDLKGLFSREGSHVAWVAFDPELLAKHQSEGRTVFVDFTANWCPNCKYNEFNVYESAEVRALMERKGVVAMKADITNDGPCTDMIRRLMSELGARSIPFCAVFPGDRPKEPFVRLDIVTVAMMREIFLACPDP